MLSEINGNLDIHYGMHISSKKIAIKANQPFKDHPQFALLIDILSRKLKHHAHLILPFSQDIYLTFLEAFILHLSQKKIPAVLQDAELIYFDMEKLAFSNDMPKDIEKEFHEFHELLNKKNNYLLFVLTDTEVLSKDNKHINNRFLHRQFEALLSHPKARFLILTSDSENNKVDNRFSTLNISKLNSLDILNLLKDQSNEFENYHQVLIPEELLALSYRLTERYLSTENTLQNTLLLLDSSAARATICESHEETFTPILTLPIIANVLSNWTNIPAFKIQEAFNRDKFILGMQKTLFEQDHVISCMANTLQQSPYHLVAQSPIARFLLAGPASCGKHTTATALANQLFGVAHALYYVNPQSQDLLNLTVESVDHQQFELKNIIATKPYAIFLFENINLFNSDILNELNKIFTNGVYADKNGKLYYFQHSLFLFTVKLAEVDSASIHGTLALPNTRIKQTAYEMNLMQLVLNGSPDESDHTNTNANPLHDLEKTIHHQLTTLLPESFLSQITLLPFVPLSKQGIEKIIRHQLKLLGNHLVETYNIELGYAPEVIRFLTSEMNLTLTHHAKDIKKMMASIHQLVETTLSQSKASGNLSENLILQLDEKNENLRCDWLTITTIKEYIA